MLRLTLRSGADGRVAARIVDRDGTVFVLDHGDPATVAEASKLVLHGGFEVRWLDTTETASPGSPGFLQKLAVYYASRGWLVAVEEPGWPRVGGIDPLDAPRPAPKAAPLTGPTPLDASLGAFEATQSLMLDDPLGNEPDTEILSRSDLLGPDGTSTSGALAVPTAPRPSEEPTLPLATDPIGQAVRLGSDLTPRPIPAREPPAGIDHDAPTEERPRR